jgi:hypothetical protein
VKAESRHLGPIAVSNVGYVMVSLARVGSPTAGTGNARYLIITVSNVVNSPDSHLADSANGG